MWSASTCGRYHDGFTCDRTGAYPIVGAVLGFTHLGILVEAAYSIKAGAKTQGFAASRVLEAVVEAGPQSLLQLCGVTLFDAS